MLLLQIVDKLLKIERRSNATANIVYHHQIFIRLTKKTFHGCHLTGTSTNKYGFASLQSFTNSDIKTIKMTLQIFTGTQTRQNLPCLKTRTEIQTNLHYKWLHLRNHFFYKSHQPKPRKHLRKYYQIALLYSY